MKNRTVKQRIEFNIEGDFESFYAAEKWCKENGFSYGRMDGHNPIALWKGDCCISKWHNLSQKEKNSCDGVMLGERNGAVKILIYEII